MPAIDLNPLGPDDIASFNATIVTLRGEPVGTCLKLRRLDGRDHVLHLRPDEAGRLVKALQDYIELGHHQNLMFQLHRAPGLAATLPPAHPYNTLVSMSPKFGPDEAGEGKKSTDVVESTFTARASFVTYMVKFRGGEQAQFRLHECVAFNLWAFITKMVSDAEALFGRAGGNA